MNIKNILAAAMVLAAFSIPLSAQKYVEASDLKLIGKPFPDTPNPYHRVDTAVYKGFNTTENRQLRCPAGMAVRFRTDSRSISVAADWGYIYGGLGTMPVAVKGFDLYILNSEGKWQYAASGAGAVPEGRKGPGELKLIGNMDGSMHECMLYLPMYSELRSCRIGVDEDAVIEASESGFRHRIAVYGSSFTQGVGVGRSGMSWPMQLMRATGMQVVSLATSGRCLMQPYMTDVLEDVQADAFIFDTFSNPDSTMIRERLMPFLDRMVAAHPGVPLIFQRTIYRERRNFETALDARERAKANAVEEMFRDILGKERYKDVYLITPNASDNHETSVDGTHPGSYGYTIWTDSIKDEVLAILAKYGIK
ncbi:MAG: SGNH/GDSL hydrolase N-terminal domain-containing protein [Candidatus Cryptobacteroides sp.]